MFDWFPIFVGAGVAGVSFGSWGLFRKGGNQALIRSCIILTLACCYLFWAVMYIAQLHPLIKPQRQDIKPKL